MTRPRAAARGSLSSMVSRNAARWFTWKVSSCVDDPPRPGDQPGVIEQHVDAGVPGPQLAREIPDLIKMGEVGDVALRAQLRRDGARLAR